MTPEPDPYEILGVAPAASDAEITSAYRRRVRQLHPDSRVEDTDADTTLADVLAAYEVLRDPQRRAAYYPGHRDPHLPGRPGPISIPVRRIERDTPPTGTTWLRAGPVRLDPQPPFPARPAAQGPVQPLSHELERILVFLLGRW